ncbi:MAG: hypothetical protein LQ337_006496 [Flavoplaca oasis]|nr:MAG: hypothetical protein LQ337_006496 [Flavoplaca oasis]
MFRLAYAMTPNPLPLFSSSYRFLSISFVTMESLTKETSASEHRETENADMGKAAQVEVMVIGKHGTESDARDMRRMGKPQSLQRNFAFYSTFGFSMVLMSSWEVQLAAATFGLTNGGTAGAIYIYIATFSGFGMAIVSMAEMASMAPTAGGQYHWVSEFAAPGAQKFVSYMTGWLCVLGWQAGTASGCYLGGPRFRL